ncbi:hypothetical protein QAD02_014928 [Eretmocerus hayati]|uniref:Uncharacterized protein n=1 Tax=Eretmocerus hayati TaxID=131215 RepID=A0ACC2P832_9HYME|nr:hypothetical protein QAD02_014928 [Eretmocerus hayati]
MYTCIHCGAAVDELYRRYSPSVLKVVKCESCGNLADKYIEYDPVIVLVDLVLLEKPAYSHLLYNSNFGSYWKLMIVLIFGESYRQWETPSSNPSSSINATNTGSIKLSSNSSRFGSPIIELLDSSGGSSGVMLIFQGERNFYLLLVHTALSLAAFVAATLVITELRWAAGGAEKPRRYRAIDLVRALVIGGCAKLLGLLGIVWQHIAPEPHHALIYGYTVLCLLTAYSVVCESGRTGSLIGLSGGLLAHNYVYNVIIDLYLTTANMTMLQS